MFEEILFPVDFSPRCEAMAPAVVAMARHYGARLTVLHAAELIHPELDCEAVTEDLRRIRAHLGERLEAYLVPELEGAGAVRELTDGPPGEAIVRRAAAMTRPLIMMPSHGYSAFRQLLLGSVTAKVLHDAACPVWTSAHCEGGSPVPAVYRSVVCAVDMGKHTLSVLQAAREFAYNWQAALSVVHSVPGIRPVFESAAADRSHAFLKQTAQEQYPLWAAASRVDAPLEIAEEVGLANGIAAAVARHNADLLVIGRGAIHGVIGRLRSNAHDLIRASPCPVLSI